MNKKKNAMSKLEKNLVFLAQRNATATVDINKALVKRQATVDRNIVNSMTKMIVDVANESGIKKKKIKKIVKSSKINKASEAVSKSSVKELNKGLDKVADKMSIPDDQLKDIGLKKPIRKSINGIDEKLGKITKLKDIDKLSSKNKKDKTEKKKRKLEKENDEAAKETANFISKSMKGLTMDSSDVSTLPKSGGKKKKVKKSSGAKFTEDMLKGMNFAD